MKLNEIIIEEAVDVAKLQAELKTLNKELVSAKGAGNTSMVEQIQANVDEIKEQIKNAS